MTPTAISPEISADERDRYDANDVLAMATTYREDAGPEPTTGTAVPLDAPLPF